MTPESWIVLSFGAIGVVTNVIAIVAAIYKMEIRLNDRIDAKIEPVRTMAVHNEHRITKIEAAGACSLVSR